MAGPQGLPLPSQYVCGMPCYLHMSLLRLCSPLHALGLEGTWVCGRLACWTCTPLSAYFHQWFSLGVITHLRTAIFAVLCGCAGRWAWACVAPAAAVPPGPQRPGSGTASRSSTGRVMTSKAASSDICCNRWLNPPCVGGFNPRCEGCCVELLGSRMLAIAVWASCWRLFLLMHQL